VIGIFLGYTARKAIQFSEKKGLIDKESFLSYSIAVALIGTGFLNLIGSSDFIAVFLAGNVITWTSWFNEQVAETHFQNVIDSLCKLFFFFF